MVQIQLTHSVSGLGATAGLGNFTDECLIWGE